MNEPSSAPACYSHKYHVNLENRSVKLKFNFEVKCSLQAYKDSYVNFLNI